jgi:transcription-repair coupling factor (superfamily II helicase)
LQRLYPGARTFAQAKALSIPLPSGTDAELIAWVGGVLHALFGANDPAPSAG